MQALDTTYQELLFTLDSESSVRPLTPITFGNGDHDDLVASQTQLQYSACASSFNQEQFRMIAENLQDSGVMLYLFC